MCSDEWTLFSAVLIEEYENSLVEVYGYCVEKKPDGTFSFHPVSVNGKVIFDDGSTAVVDGARWAEEEE